MISIGAFKKGERLTVLAQTKLTESESAQLDELVGFYRSHGVRNATRSAVVRALIADSLAEHKEDIDNWKELSGIGLDQGNGLGLERSGRL